MSRAIRYAVIGGVMDFTIYIALSLATLLAVTWAARKVDLALLPLVWGVCYSASAVFGGRLSDRFSRTRTARVGLVLVVLTCLCFSRASATWHFYLGMPVIAFGMALFWPALQASIADESGPGELTRNLGWFNISWSLGKGLGVMAGGALLELLGRRGFLVAAAVGVALFLLLPRVPRGGGHGSPFVEETVQVPAAVRRRFWIAALLGNFAAFGLGTTLINLYPEWNHVVAERSGFAFGLVVGGVFLAQTVAFAVLLKRPGWPYRRLPHLLPQFAAGAGVLLFVTGLPVIALLPFVFAVGAGLGIAYSTSIYYSLHVDAARGGRAGLHEAILGTGNWIVPLLGGGLAAWLGSSAAPMIFAAAVVLVATAIQMALLFRSDVQ